VVRPLSAVPPGKGAEMLNSGSAQKRQRESADYLAARENWLKRVLADRDLSQRAKVVAGVLYFYFSSEEFIKDGKLFAWPSSRTLDKQSGLSRNTVKEAVDDLEAAGYLKIQRRYDAESSRYKSHLLLAVAPTDEGGGSESGKEGWVKQLTQGGSTSSPRVGQLVEPYSMNDSMTDSMNIDNAAFGGEREFEEEGSCPDQIPSSRPEAVEREAKPPNSNGESAPDRGYTQRDIETVRGAIEDGGLTEIADIVRFARAQKQRFLTAFIIGTMCRDGLFGRDGETIWLLPAAPTDVGARLDEVET
jgi:Helix-turn-helix domain